MNISTAALALITDFLQVLAEVSRLQILCCLREGEQNVTQIVQGTGLGQANVSKQLQLLARAGLVTREQRGIKVYYQVANPALFELCDLVGKIIANRAQTQGEQLKKLESLDWRKLGHESLE